MSHKFMNMNYENKKLTMTIQTWFWLFIMKMNFKLMESCLEYKIAYIIQFDLVLLIKLMHSDALRENVSRQLYDAKHIIEFLTWFELHKLLDHSVFPLKSSQWELHKLPINPNKRAKQLKLLGECIYEICSLFCYFSAWGPNCYSIPVLPFP